MPKTTPFQLRPSIKPHHARFGKKILYPVLGLIRSKRQSAAREPLSKIVEMRMDCLRRPSRALSSSRTPSVSRKIRTTTRVQVNSISLIIQFIVSGKGSETENHFSVEQFAQIFAEKQVKKYVSGLTCHRRARGKNEVEFSRFLPPKKEGQEDGAFWHQRGKMQAYSSANIIRSRLIWTQSDKAIKIEHKSKKSYTIYHKIQKNSTK